MQVITSKDNEKIKEIRKIKDNKKVRDEKGVYIVEGTKMIEEAIREKVEIETLVICEDCLEKETIDSKLLYEIAKYECIYVSDKIFNTLTEVVHPQGVLAIVKQPDNAKINYKDNMIVVLDNIQDPGNLGTIIRTADAAGLSQVLVTKNSVDAYNPKVIRSTMGAIFRVKVVIIDNIEQLKQNGYSIVATSLQGNKSIYDIQYKKHAIIIGNEANGVSKEMLEAADIKAKIPMKGKAESLNASVAASIMIYEYVRQNI